MEAGNADQIVKSAPQRESMGQLREKLESLVAKTDEILRETRLDLNQAMHNSEKARAKALDASVNHLTSLRDQLAAGLEHNR